jgi:hypothetical protein
MLSAFLKIVERVQAAKGNANASNNSLFGAASSPLERAVSPLQASNEIAAWKQIGKEMQDQALPSALSFELQMQIALGACVWESRSLAKGQIVQVQARNRLIAVLDSRNMQVHVRPDAFPGDIDELISGAVKLERAHIPPEFKAVPMWDLVWLYGYHHPMAWRQLPNEIAFAQLNLRRLPLTSAELMQGAPMQVITQLVRSDASFGELLSSSSLEPAQVLKSVVALFLTRSLQIPGFIASRQPDR